MAEKVSDFSRNFKKYYNTKDKKMNEAVKMTQQILLGNLTMDYGQASQGVETRSMKKASVQKTAEKKEISKNDKPIKDPACKKLFQEEPEEPSIKEANLIKELERNNRNQKAQEEYSSCKNIELSLRKHSLAILDSVIANYQISEKKLQDILHTLEDLNLSNFSFHILVNSWIGKFLQLMLQLIIRSESKSVLLNNEETLRGSQSTVGANSLTIHSADHFFFY